MVNIVKVEGFEAFQAKVAELAKTGGDVFVMFSGSKVWQSDNPPKSTLFFSGQQWCKLVSRLCCGRACGEPVYAKGFPKIIAALSF